MKKYPDLNDIQNKIISNGTAHLSFYAEDIHDIIHPYSISGYECLSGDFVAFLERFRTILPKKLPLILEIKGKVFDESEKEVIDKAIWMHFGLNLSEASKKFKETNKRMFIYLIMTVLSSVFIFMAANNSNEVITNYGSILFWFFAYRLLIHLILDCKPIYEEYHWYRRLSSLKLIFSDDSQENMSAQEISKENAYYEHKADKMIKKHQFVEQILMEDSYVDLACKIGNAEDVLCQSGAGNLEIVSEEMVDYLMCALPFINQKDVAKLTIQTKELSKEQQNRISSAIRNQMAFIISEQDAQRDSNKGVSILFTVGLLLSTIVLYVWGKEVDIAVHEFILVLFWFFADFLLEFVILTRKEIKYQKKTLEKLAEMEILFKVED